MNTYRIDFAMERGHEMIIDKFESICRDELDDLELSMLQSVKVPYLLPMSWQELNGGVTFRYQLNGCKMLSHLLQQRLTMNQFYVLLLALTDALDECRHYMLRPEACLLEDQYIFVNGQRLQEVRLAYLPLKEGIAPSSNGASSLLALVVRWTAFVDNLDGEGLKQILQHMNGRKWPLQELRETLLERIGGAAIGGISRYAAVTVVEERKPASMGYHIAEAPAIGRMPRPPAADKRKDKDESNTSQRPLIGSPDSGIMNGKQDSGWDVPYMGEQEEEEDRDGRRKWLVVAVSVVVTACIWRFIYLESASRQSLLICAALTLLVVGALLYLWRKRGDMLAESIEAHFDSSGFDPDSGRLRRESLQENTERSGGASFGLGSLIAMNEAQLLSDMFEQNAPSKQAAADKPAEPAPISEPTVMLGREGAVKAAKAEAWLIRRWQGSEERLKLNGASFSIGRGDEGIDYRDLASGVSRLHLQIEGLTGESEERHAAKDLGSRNGSFLNGEPMIPYKSYPLANNDMIHLASLDGSFYTYMKGLSPTP